MKVINNYTYSHEKKMLLINNNNNNNFQFNTCTLAIMCVVH